MTERDQPETSRRRSRSMGDGDATHGATPPVESHPDGEDPVPADTTSAAAARKSQACPSNIHGKASGETVGLDSSNHGNPARAKPWAGPDASGCGLTLQHPLKFVKDQRTIRHCANLTLDDYNLSAMRTQSCDNPDAAIRGRFSFSTAEGDRRRTVFQSTRWLSRNVIESVRHCCARLKGSLLANSPEASLHTRCAMADVSGRSKSSWAAERFTTSIRNVLGDEDITTGGDDDDSTSHMYFAMTVMAWNCFAVFLDFCLLLERVFTTGDWLCFDNPAKESTRPFVTGLNNVNYGLCCTMLGLTSFSLVLRASTIPGYNFIRVVVDCCHAACLVGGIGMLSILIAVCNSAADSVGFKFDYQMVTRLDLILHVARVVFGVWSALTLRMHVIKLLRVAVSQNKRRLVDPAGGFDLDLAYVCDRVIAMAIPAVHRAPYRNDIFEVARFFSQKHYGQFRVINLCEEFEENGNGNYAPSYFHGFVRKIPTRDHNACSLHQLVRFCHAASHYLNANKNNVLAIHCRGGKGRTGMFVCALMLWTRTVPMAKTAIKYFDQRRRDESKAALPVQTCTSPSQIRYVKYIQYMVQKKCSGYDAMQPSPVTINNINIAKIPEAGGYPWFLDVVIEEGGNIVYTLANASGLKVINNEDETVCIDTNGLVLSGDVAIRIYKFRAQMSVQELRPTLGVHASTCQYGLNKGAQICFIQYHTYFSQEEFLYFRDDVDKSISKKNFSNNFFIKVSSKSMNSFVDEAKEMAKNHVHVLRSSSSATSLSCGHKHEESKGGQTGPLMVTSSGNSNPGSSTPRTHGRTRFASFSNVLSRNFLRNDGSCDNMEDTVSNSPRRERVAKVENCAAARSSLFRTASSSMRSVFSSFKILGTGSRRVPVSKLQDDANPGQRFLSSAAILRLSILELCEDVEMFEPGEVVFDEGDMARSSNDVLYYIESGVCEWRWLQAEPIDELSYTRTMCFQGSGDFYGVMQHLLGNLSAARLSRVLVATTALRVRVLHLEKRINNGAGPRLRFQGFTDGLSAIAWEHIAQGQIYKAGDLGQHLNRLITQGNPLEKISEATLVSEQHRDTNAKLIEDMRTHLKLSPVDKLLHFCFAKVHTVQTKSTSTVCVLSSCLALKIYKRRFGMIGGFTYNQIQWPHVTSVSQAQHKLKIACDMRVAHCSYCSAPQKILTQFFLVQDSNAPWNVEADTTADADTTVRSGVARSLSRVTSSLNLSQNSIKTFFSGSVHQSQRFSSHVEIQIGCRSEGDASSLKSAIDKAILRTSHSRYRSNIKLYTEVTQNFMDGYSSFGYVRESEDSMEQELDSSQEHSQEESASRFLDILSQTSVTKGYNPGDVIIPRGSNHGNLFHVVSGSVIVQDQNEQTMKEIFEDDIFGEDFFALPGSHGSEFAYVAESYTTCTILSRQRAQNWVEPLHKARLYRNLARYGCVREMKRWDLCQHLSEQDDGAAKYGEDVCSTLSSNIASPSRSASFQCTQDLLDDEYPYRCLVPTPRPAVLPNQPYESMSSRCTPQSARSSVATGVSFTTRLQGTASAGSANWISSGVQSSQSCITETIAESSRSMESAAVSNDAERQGMEQVRVDILDPSSNGQSEMELGMHWNASAMRGRTEISKDFSVPLGLTAPLDSEPADAQRDPSNGDAVSGATGFEFGMSRCGSATDDVDRTTRHFISDCNVQAAISDPLLSSEVGTIGGRNGPNTKLPAVTADFVAMKVGETTSLNSATTLSGTGTLPRPGGSC